MECLEECVALGFVSSDKPLTHKGKHILSPAEETALASC